MKLYTKENLINFYKPELLTFLLLHDNMLFSTHNLKHITNENFFLINDHYFNTITKNEMKLLEKILQLQSIETFIEELNNTNVF